MYKKILNRIFIAGFVLCMAFPLVFTNLKDNVVSESENRYLTGRMHLFREDGSFNTDFLSDFESWFNDNVGFRTALVRLNGTIQYYVFHVLPNTDIYLGPEGEFNYATNGTLADYQHSNLLSDETQQSITDAFQYMDDYLAERGAQYYYVQCWDKQSIYPEQFPRTVNQYGDVSKTDQIVAAIEKSSTTVVNPKTVLTEAKAQYETYSKFGDPTHWTPRGAFVCYQLLMKTINEENGGIYKVLTEDDYDLTPVDQGMTYFGSVHYAQMLEPFILKEKHATLTNEKLTLSFDDLERNHFYTNETVENRTRVLVIGDSYFDNYLMDDLAESFYETIMIRGDYLGNIDEIIETYKPDIVIGENAERVDRSLKMVETVEKLQNK